MKQDFAHTMLDAIIILILLFSTSLMSRHLSGMPFEDIELVEYALLGLPALMILSGYLNGIGQKIQNQKMAIEKKGCYSNQTWHSYKMIDLNMTGYINKWAEAAKLLFIAILTSPLILYLIFTKKIELRALEYNPILMDYAYITNAIASMSVLYFIVVVLRIWVTITPENQNKNTKAQALK